MVLRFFREGMDAVFGATVHDSIEALETTNTSHQPVTVNIPSDQPTVQAGLDRAVEIYRARDARVDVNIETGTEWDASTIIIRDGFYTHITITSDDATVPLPDNFPDGERVIDFRQCNGPHWDILLDCDKAGTNHDAIVLSVAYNSTTHVTPGSGAINSYRGAEVHRNSRMFADDSNFSGHSDRGLSVTRNSVVAADGSNLSNNGDRSIRCSNSFVSASNADLTGGGSHAVFISYGGTVAIPGADASNASGDALEVSTTGGYLNAEGATVNNAGGNAVVVENGVLEAAGITIQDTTNNGVWVRRLGSHVNLHNATIDNSGLDGIQSHNGQITVAEAAITNNGNRGIVSASGSMVDGGGATVTGNSSSDLMVRFGGQISADGVTTSQSTGTDPHSGDMNVPPNQIQGEGLILAETVE